ncbi:MAG: hypothetical protein VYD19_07525 [Myxococcota bacterium]|nr:hypothetical protein [Myxococcota bacterium]
MRRVIRWTLFLFISQLSVWTNKSQAEPLNERLSLELSSGYAQLSDENFASVEGWLWLSLNDQWSLGVTGGALSAGEDPSPLFSFSLHWRLDVLRFIPWASASTGMIWLSEEALNPLIQARVGVTRLLDDRFGLGFYLGSLWIGTGQPRWGGSAGLNLSCSLASDPF